jgi:membrane-bound serine protease (ClpP class)
MNEVKDLGNNFCDTCLKLDELQVEVGSSGNLSFRKGDELVITPSGTSYVDVNPRSNVTVHLKTLEAQVNSKEELLKVTGIENYEIIEQKLSWIDQIIMFLINPFVSGILIMLIIGGIYFELQTPGIGFPLIVAIIAALLFFAPHYLGGLAAHWEILIFIIGLILLIVEIFVIPGFGVFGIVGISLMVLSLILAMIFNIKFNFELTSSSEILKTSVIVVTSLVFGFILSIWLGKKLIVTETRYGTIALKT